MSMFSKRLCWLCWLAEYMNVNSYIHSTAENGLTEIVNRN